MESDTVTLPALQLAPLGGLVAVDLLCQADKGKPVIDGLVVLAAQETGEILALMDGKTVTAMRTGAVTGTSIRHLAREDASSVGLVGCGWRRRRRA